MSHNSRLLCDRYCGVAFSGPAPDRVFEVLAPGACPLPRGPALPVVWGGRRIIHGVCFHG